MNLLLTVEIVNTVMCAIFTLFRALDIVDAMEMHEPVTRRDKMNVVFGIISTSVQTLLSVIISVYS